MQVMASNVLLPFLLSCVLFVGGIRAMRSSPNELIKIEKVDSSDRHDFTRSAVKTGGYEYAAVVQKESGVKYTGASAIISPWKPEVHELVAKSVGKIRISASQNGARNAIEIGWQVNPMFMYGDKETYFYIFMENATHSCYNALCHDTFIHPKTVRVGGPETPSKVDGAISQGLLQLEMKPNGDWHALENGHTLGYWPSRVLPLLSKGGVEVMWGGEIVTSISNGEHTKTQMGSGRFPAEGFNKAAHILDPKYVKANDPKKNVPVDCTKLRSMITNSNCYDLACGKHEGKTIIFYGGPGFNDKCKAANPY